MSIEIFGAKSAVPDVVAQAEVPVGTPCPVCEKNIVDGDVGFTLPFLNREEGDPKRVSYHRRCLHEVIGIADLSDLSD